MIPYLPFGRFGKELVSKTVTLPEGAVRVAGSIWEFGSTPLTNKTLRFTSLAVGLRTTNCSVTPSDFSPSANHHSELNPLAPSAMV